MKIEKLYTKIVEPELVSNNRRNSTIKSLERAVRRFNEYEKACKKKIKIKKIKRKDLLGFRDFLSKTCNIPTQNGTVQGIVQLLKTAYKNELIKTVPYLEPLPNTNKEYKIFPTDEEICRLWENTKHLEWPTKDSLGNKIHYSPDFGWKAVLMFFRTFGFRTQELIKFELGFKSITWNNINYNIETPNPEGNIKNDNGWLVYIPQKQIRIKSDPLYIPLPNYVKKVVDILDIDQNRDTSIIDWSMSHVTFMKNWKRLMDISNVKPKETSGLEYYLPKHFRKCATTRINDFMPNMAQYIIGHASDRSGQNSVVSDKHYYNAEQAIYKCIHNMPYPKCFDEIV